jgi:hypothetical protein
MSITDHLPPTDHPHPQTAHIDESRYRWQNAVVFGIIVGGLAAGGTWLCLPKAKDTASSIIQINTPVAIGELAGRDQAREALEKSYVAQAKSRFVLNAVFREKPELAKLGMLQSPDVDPVEALEKIVKVEFVGPGLMSISVTGNNPDELAELAKALAQAFIDEVLNKQRTDKLSLLKYLDEVATQAKQDFDIRNKTLQLLAKEPLASDRSIRDRLQILNATNANELNSCTSEIRRLEVAIRTKESKQPLDDAAAKASIEELRDRLNYNKALAQAVASDIEKIENELRQLDAGGGVKIDLASHQAAAEVARQAYIRAETAHETLKLEIAHKADLPAWVMRGEGEITHGADLKPRIIATTSAGVGGLLLVLLCAAVMQIRSRRKLSLVPRFHTCPQCGNQFV